MSTSRRYLLALVSSCLLFVASPGQWAVTPLAWVALLPLLVACQGLRPRAGFRLGLAAGLLYYVGLIYWITIALGRYGGLPAWISLPALLGLAGYMALYLALFVLVICWIDGRLPLFWSAPLLWVGLDWLRARLFTGFPWLDLGYSQSNWPLVNQVADLTGHYGVTFLIVLVNAGLALAWQGRGGLSLRPFLAPLLLLALALAYDLGRYRQVEAIAAAQPRLRLGLVQGNIDQSEKWLPELQDKTVATYLDLSRQAAAKKDKLDLLIWPETALPFFPDDNPLFGRVTAAVGKDGAESLLTGAPHFEIDLATGRTRYFNSAFLISPGPGQGVALQRYDKEHLVPFGEYVPLASLLPSATPLVQTMGNFTPGIAPEPLVRAQARLGMLICFESIFPDEARVRTGRGANLLVNLTNDAWYGRSSAPFQQVPMAVLRAIENRRSLARAANTGISCLIDPLGRVLAATPIFETLEVSGQLPLMEGYPFFVRLGFLFPQLCLLVLSSLLFYGNFRWNRVRA